MFIINSDRNCIVNTDNSSYISLESNNSIVASMPQDSVVLGKYKSWDKTVKIFDEIAEKLAKPLDTGFARVYKMPEE